MAPAKPATRRKRVFTVEQANRALPLVAQIVTDIVAQWTIVSEMEQRLSAVPKRVRSRRDGTVYDEEIAHSESSLDSERAKLQILIDELKALGVELKGSDGLCDFPSERDGREVYLCWRLGEPAVHYWHELHTGFAGRQPLDASRPSLEKAGHHA